MFEYSIHILVDSWRLLWSWSGLGWAAVVVSALVFGYGLWQKAHELYRGEPHPSFRWRAAMNALRESVRPTVGGRSTKIAMVAWLCLFLVAGLRTSWIKYSALQNENSSLKATLAEAMKENNDLKRKAVVPELPTPSLQILYENEPLSGRTLIVPQTFYPDAKAYGIALAPIELKNPPGGPSVEGISMRIYFASKLTSIIGAPLSANGARTMLESFVSDEPEYQSTAYWGSRDLRISAGEIWTGPRLELSSNKEFSTNMRVMVKVYLGASKPAIAKFMIRGLEPRQQVRP